MSRTSMLITLGALVILVPFSGLPIAFRSLLNVIFGACVLGIGIAMRTHHVHKLQSKIETLSPSAAPQNISPI